MKKITNSVRTIVAMILLTTTMLTANAQNVGDKFKVGELYYKITSTSPKEVETAPQNDKYPYWNEGENPEGDLIIPATVEIDEKTYTVTKISKFSYAYCYKLKSVTIPNTVTTIGEYAFLFDKIVSASIPNSVIKIEKDAFQYCYSLNSLVIPQSVTDIGDMAFEGCKSLTSVTIPKSVTDIGINVFSKCIKMKKIDVEEGNTVVCSEDGILFNKDKTVLKQFPAGKVITNYTVPNSVKKIEIKAFYGSEFLTSVTIPKSVTKIGLFAFGFMPKIDKIEVEENNTAYSSQDGVLFNKTKTELIKYPVSKTTTNYTIPNSVEKIHPSAFNSCSKLISVTFPNSILELGRFAFDNCTALKSIISNIENVGNVNMIYGVFHNVNKKTCTLYVPKGKVEEYKNAEQWKDFENIKEIGTGIRYTKLTNPISVDGNNITVSQVNDKKVILYNLSGKVLYNLHAIKDNVTLKVPQAGTYILQVDNGTRKIVVN